MSTKKKIYGLKDLEKSFGKLTFGRVLSSWRAREELSQKEFAKRIGISAANLCDIEKGRKGVSPEKAEQIALILGSSPTFLVKLAIEEQLQAAGLKYEIEVKAA
ncbi:MAG: helix-turn-helix transcriptional regulator [Xanthomonadaceae bacterium]|nr:helix-turn-helix transcriptional regulator [Xanthomonadaceae bacterium]